MKATDVQKNPNFDLDEFCSLKRNLEAYSGSIYDEVPLQKRKYFSYLWKCKFSFEQEEPMPTPTPTPMQMVSAALSGKRDRASAGAEQAEGHFRRCYLFGSCVDDDDAVDDNDDNDNVDNNDNI